MILRHRPHAPSDIPTPDAPASHNGARSADSRFANRQVPAVQPFDERNRLTILALMMALPLLIYNILLLERKWGLLLNNEPFLQTRLLTSWEKLTFAIVFSAATLLLIVTAVRGIHFLAQRFFPRSSWNVRISLALAGVTYFWAISSQVEAFQYFKDSLNLALVQGMGGGDLTTAFAYITNDFAGLLPLIGLWCAFMIAGGWVYKRYGFRSLVSLISRSRAGRKSHQAVLVANVVMVVLPLPIGFVSPALADALGFGIAYRIYEAPAVYLTDIDRDGYGLIGRFRDFAPLDASRFPYALDIPGNGIDEDSVGGDLPAVIWQENSRPVWESAKLEQKNVLLIVMDSIRSDVLDAQTSTGPVMPVLRSLPGKSVRLVSHYGFTATSIIGFFNSTIDEQNQGSSLIDRFNALGYRTGVFSGQHEGFGDIATRTGMPRADAFVDATGFPAERRMHSSTTRSALAMPAPLVNARFAQWLETLDRGSPFFAYINWQEMHFPYHYRGAPTPLITDPVQRGNIRPSNRQQVWQTYLNAARSLDDNLSGLISLLKRSGRWDDTVLLVFGDHGEELFEHGYLGHGIHLSFEQYAPLCKLINSRWTPPPDPAGMSEVENLIYNALLRPGNDPVRLKGEVLCFTGPTAAPGEIGVISRDGLVKYNFARQAWTRQPAMGSRFSPAAPVDRVIHLWESYRIAQQASLKGGGQ